MFRRAVPNVAVQQVPVLAASCTVSGIGVAGRVGMPRCVPLPEAMRPPGYVLRFDRPLRGLVARVQAPGGTSRWLRIDSIAFKQRERVKWVVTTFFETPPPSSPAPAADAARRLRRIS